MTMMRLFLTVVSVGLVVSGCADDRELAINPDGVDRMRLSPCACAEIEFNQDDEGYVRRG